ncbi:MAG: MFS transporter [Coriobacteriales bacterium]|jgi:DHA1 family bicyclomycin/chloramphenicol resistance-like MFS transporter|nr:MFS transporter [Coriobacteriales bacterium]
MQLTDTGKNQRFGTVGLIILISLLEMLGVFVIDMYSPALPEMAETFNTSDSIVNLTMLLFFIFQVVGMLVFGPLSDRTGRRPLLLLVMLLFIVSSLAGVFAPDIQTLIGVRIVQAIAAGALVSICMALVKDSFVGRSRESVLMVLQALFILGPIVAPIIGAQLLVWFSWRSTFVVFAIFGILTLPVILAFRESIAKEDRMSGSLLHSFVGLADVVRNGRFMVFMLATSLCIALPFNSYLTLAPYIYEGFFGFSPLEYSYFFAATAGLSALGLVIYRAIANKVALRHLTSALIVCVGIAGLVTAVLAKNSAFIFCAAMLLLQIVGMMMRPYSTNILFDLQKEDTGSASAMMNCSFAILGSAGIALTSLFNDNYLLAIGTLMCAGFILSLALWLGLLCSKTKMPGIKE